MKGRINSRFELPVQEVSPTPSSGGISGREQVPGKVPAIRFKVDPGDVAPAQAARRLGLTLLQFAEKLPDLLRRGFPPPDPTTGNFDLDAIDLWRKLRHRQLFGLTLNEMPTAALSQPSLGEKLRAAKERLRNA